VENSNFKQSLVLAMASLMIGALCLTLHYLNKPSARCCSGALSVQAGAGIVADSVPDMEYQETINKANGLLEAIAYA
jgi:chorismate binding enzyme